jgi:pSer/pThr/pTyr-binding forkhead associated (FHA) protein
MPRLVIHHAGQDSRVLELSGDRPVSIGRAKSSTLVLNDPSVSRLHAIVRAAGEGRWEIIDRDSSNGVSINGVVIKEAILRANDEIRLGEYHLRFEDSSARKMLTYGTTDIPSRVADALNQSVYGASPAPSQNHAPAPAHANAQGRRRAHAYTGSSLAVESVAGAAAHDLTVSSQAYSASAASAPGARPADHENRLLALLNRVNRTLAEMTSLESVIQRSLDLVLEIDGTERAYCMLLDDATVARSGDWRKRGYSFEPASIRYRRPPRNDGERSTELVISQSIIKQVMQAGLPRLISDATADPRLSSSASIIRGGILSAMCAPLGIGDRLRGLLYADNLSQRGMFTVEDLNVFSVIAVQTGLAIERVRPRSEVLESVR